MKQIRVKMFMVMAVVFSLFVLQHAYSGEKNPCGKNPCDMTGGKNPCGKNPCGMTVKKIRKTPVLDMNELMKLGEKLFNDTKLGKSGMSCASCHPDGEGLKKTPYPRYINMADDTLTLDQMINFCMINPMKGKPFQWNSKEITALSAYVQAHSKTEGKTLNPCGAMKNPCGMK